MGSVVIGTIPNTSTYKLDVLGNLRTQGGGGIVSSGIIQASNGITVSGQVLTTNAGITVPAGQTLTSAGTLTASIINGSGLITTNGGITVPAGQTLTVNGSFAPSTLTVSGLITANGGITVPAGQTITANGGILSTSITSSGLITGNSGITVPSGQTITANGGISSTTLTTSGLITATNTSTGTSDSLNIRYDTRNGIRFQQRYIGTDDVRYDLIQKVANVDKTASLTFNNGNVGIGTTDTSTYLLNVNGSQFINNQLIFSNRTKVQDNFPCYKIRIWGDNLGSGNYGFGFSEVGLDYFSGLSHRFYTGSTSTVFGTERMRITDNGNVGIGTTNPQSSYKLQVEGNTYVANTLVFNNNYRSGGADYACNKISLFGGGNTPTTTSSYGFGIASDTVEYFSNTIHRWYYSTVGGTSYGSIGMTLSNNYLDIGGSVGASGNVHAGTYLSCGGEGGFFFRFSSPDSWIRLRSGGDLHRDFAAGTIYAHYEIYGRFTSVSMTGTDYLCIQQNASFQGQELHGIIRSAFGSFTAFHRCYTDDVLYNGDTQENIDLFKNDYMGRVVIATGKIKTDFTRDVEPTESEPESDIKKAPNSEWYSGIDKDGIAVEDAIPVVALSRKKKDKRISEYLEY